jgi:hypothetical protein
MKKLIIDSLLQSGEDMTERLCHDLQGVRCINHRAGVIMVVDTEICPNPMIAARLLMDECAIMLIGDVEDSRAIEVMDAKIALSLAEVAMPLAKNFDSIKEINNVIARQVIEPRPEIPRNVNVTSRNVVPKGYSYKPTNRNNLRNNRRH